MHLPVAVAAAAAASLLPQDTRTDPTGLLDEDWRVRNRAAFRLVEAERVDQRALIAVLANEDGRARRVDHPERWTFGGRGRIGADDPVEKSIMRPDMFVGVRFSGWNSAAGLRAIEDPRDLCVPWGSRELAAWVLGERRIGSEAAVDALDAAQAQNTEDTLRLQAARALVRIGAPAAGTVIAAAMADHDRQDSMALALAGSGDAGNAKLLEFAESRALFDQGAVAAKLIALDSFDLEWLRAHPDALDRVFALFYEGPASISGRAGAMLQRVGDAAVARLRDAFQQPRSGEAMLAAGLLALMGSAARDAAADLVSVLDDVPPPTAVWIAQAISAMRPDRPVARDAAVALERRLDTARLPAETLSILEAFGVLGEDLDDGAVSKLVEAVASSDLATRLVAIRALAKVGRKGWSAFDALAAIAADPDDPAREDALRAVATMGRRALPIVERAVLAEVRAEAEAAAARAEQEPVEGGRLPTPEPAWAREAIERQDPEIKRHLLLWLEHESAALRRLALVGLGGLEPFAGEFVEPIRGVAQHPDASIRAAAAEALGSYRQFADDVLPDLWQALDDREAAVREAAFRALIRLDVPAVWETARLDVDHRRPERRAIALRILAERDPLDDVAHDALVAALEDESRRVRTLALELLADKGRPSPEVVGALQRFLPGRPRERDLAITALLALARRTR